MADCVLREIRTAVPGSLPANATLKSSVRSANGTLPTYPPCAADGCEEYFRARSEKFSPSCARLRTSWATALSATTISRNGTVRVDWPPDARSAAVMNGRSEEHTSELQPPHAISYAVF